MVTRVAVELSDRELEQLDRAVARGGFESREAAVRAALRSALLRPDEDEIAEAYRRAYEHTEGEPSVQPSPPARGERD